MDLFKAITAAVGWVSSSFAGVSAILYACGYLISRAQLRSLGLFGIVERSPDYFLQEGASFFVVLVMSPLELLPWLAAAAILLVAIAVLLLPLEIALYRRRARVLPLLARARERIAGRIERRPLLWRVLAFGGLFAFLLFHLTSYLVDFTPALEVRDLLYRQPVETDVARWILHGESLELKNHFFVLVSAALQAGLTLAVAWYVTRPLRGRPWLLAPFILLFMLYTLFLPIAYGALMRPSRFPLVALRTESPLLLAGVRGKLFLLKKDESEFVLWDQRARRVLWLPSGAVRVAAVKEIRPVFQKGKEALEQTGRQP